MVRRSSRDLPGAGFCLLNPPPGRRGEMTFVKLWRTAQRAAVVTQTLASRERCRLMRRLGERR